MARPTKYEPRYCEMIIDHMSEGYSAVSFAGKVGVVRSTINKWADDFPEFKEALDVAKSRALMFWEDRLINVAKGGGGPGSGPVAIFGVTNLGDGHWRNKQEHEVSGGVNITISKDDADL